MCGSSVADDDGDQHNGPEDIDRPGNAAGGVPNDAEEFAGMEAATAAFTFVGYVVVPSVLGERYRFEERTNAIRERMWSVMVSRRRQQRRGLAGALRI